jgi:protein SCO1
MAASSPAAQARESDSDNRHAGYSAGRLYCVGKREAKHLITRSSAAIRNSGVDVTVSPLATSAAFTRGDKGALISCRPVQTRGYHLSSPAPAITLSEVKAAMNLNRRPIMSRAIRMLAATALLLLMAGASESTSYAANGLDYLPNVALTNQNGAAVSLDSLRGEPVLIGFIHTMCKGPCEMMTSEMRAVHEALQSKSKARVTMLLITTDPADDGPSQLLAYARKQDIAQHGWILVTGPHKSIRRLMKIYGVSHEDTDDAMMHVMKLFLVAPDGSLAHTYPGMKTSPQAVAADIISLSPHASAGATQSARSGP